MSSQVQLKQVIAHTQMEQMEYSLAAERRRMRLIHAEIITDLLSSSTAQLGTDISLYSTRHFKNRFIKRPCFCALIRRMPGVSGRCGSWADTCWECRAGASAPCQPPSQHFWGPDYGLDGKCGYNCSKVCTRLFYLYTCNFFQTAKTFVRLLRVG